MKLFKNFFYKYLYKRHAVKLELSIYIKFVNTVYLQALMKKTNLNYSPKDIPAHSKQAYFIKLFEMTNSFLNKNR